MSNAWANRRWFLAYWISRTGAALGRLLPTRVWYAIAEPFVAICFLVMSKPRRILIENLSRVVGPEKAESAARQVFRNFARYVIDFYQLPSLGQDVLRKRIVFGDWQRLDASLTEGDGVIFVTLHLGQVELGASGLAAYGHAVNVIAEPFTYPPMNEFIQGLRHSLGMKVIPAKKAKPGLLRSLNRGEVLCLMADAVPDGQGVPVQFLDGTYQLSDAPARLALRTGARIIPGIAARDRADPTLIEPILDFDLHFEPTGDEEADVRAITQQIACSFEDFVRRFPEQWFAFHRVFSASRPHPGQSGNRAIGQDGEEGSEDADEDGGEAWKLWALRAAVKLGGVLPRNLAYGMARLAGDAAYWKRDAVRAGVEDNMRHVMGQGASSQRIRKAAREAFRNVARYYVDLVRLPEHTSQELMSHVRLHNFDRLTELLATGKGVIVVTAHFGNPEMAVQVGAILGLNVLTLAEPLRPQALAHLMNKIRSGFGTRYVDVGYGGIAACIRHLRAGGCLAFTCDRDIQGNGMPVEFFGTPAKLPLGAVELAMRTGAYLMPAYVRRARNGFDLTFEEPLQLVNTGHPKEDAPVNVRALIARIEPWIRSDPGQWMPLERIWDADVVATSPRPKVLMTE